MVLHLINELPKIRVDDKRGRKGYRALFLLNSLYDVDEEIAREKEREKNAYSLKLLGSPLERALTLASYFVRSLV